MFLAYSVVGTTCIRETELEVLSFDDTDRNILYITDCSNYRHVYAFEKDTGS